MSLQKFLPGFLLALLRFLLGVIDGPVLGIIGSSNQIVKLVCVTLFCAHPEDGPTRIVTFYERVVELLV